MTDVAGRADPPPTADEATTLVSFLDFHRETLRWKTDGLDAEQLRRPLAPSTMTLGGLLKHLAHVEGSWFVQVMLDEPADPPFDTAPWDEDPDWEWTSAADDDPDALRALHAAAVARSRAVTAELLRTGGLETLSRRTSRRTGEPFTLRWVLVHMIEEYARHNGHADLLREAVDGLRGE